MPILFFPLMQIIFLLAMIVMEQCVSQGISVQENSNSKVGERQLLDFMYKSCNLMRPIRFLSLPKNAMSINTECIALLGILPCGFLFETLKSCFNFVLRTHFRHKITLHIALIKLYLYQ